MAVRWNSGTVYGAVVYVHAGTRVCAGVEENTRVYSVPDRLIFQGRCQHHHHHHQVLAIHNLSHALPIPMSLLKQRWTCTRKASYSSLANNASHTARCRYVSRAFLPSDWKMYFPPSRNHDDPRFSWHGTSSSSSFPHEQPSSPR